MKAPARFAHQLILVLVCSLTLETFAQTKGVPAVMPSVAVDLSAVRTRRLPEFTSDNLPLDEIVERLRREFPEMNFVVAEKVRGLGVFVILRSVNLEELLKGLELACEGKLRVVREGERFVMFEAAQKKSTAGDEIQMRAYSLADYLAGPRRNNRKARSMNWSKC